MPHYYKWTDDRGRSCHGGSHDWVQTPSLTVPGRLVVCKNGIHVATALQAIKYGWLTSRCAEVTDFGKLYDVGDKAVTQYMTIGRWCMTPRLLQLWAADCAERALGLYEKRYPGDMRPRIAIEVARQYACGLVSIAARDAAWDAAGAAVSNAAWDAANDAANDAAWGAAMAAARTAAWDAAAAAAGAVAGAVALAVAGAAAGAAARDAARDGEFKWQVARLQDYLDGKLPAPAEPYRAYLMELP